MANEDECLLACNFVPSKSPEHQRPMLRTLKSNLTSCGHGQPEVLFTDNVPADAPTFTKELPSLLLRVTPPEPPNPLKLPMATIPSDFNKIVLNNAAAMNAALMPILQDAADGGNVVLGLDAEWDFLHSKYQGPIATINISYKKMLFLLQVCLKNGMLQCVV